MKKIIEKIIKFFSKDKKSNEYVCVEEHTQWEESFNGEVKIDPNLINVLKNVRDKISCLSLKIKETGDKSSRLSLALFVVSAVSLLVMFVNLSLYSNNLKILEKSNQIYVQPFLDLHAEYKIPYKFSNKGNGPALNIFMIIGGKDKKIQISRDKDVLSALKVDGDATIKKEELIELSVEIEKKLDNSFREFINKYKKESINWIAIFYEDLYGSKFVTKMNGEGGEFNECVKFEKLD